MTPGWTDKAKATNFSLTDNVAYAEDWSHPAPENAKRADGSIFQLPPGQILNRADGKINHLNYSPVGQMHGDQVYRPWVYNVDPHGNSTIIEDGTTYALNPSPVNGINFVAGINANLNLLPWVTA